MDKVDIIIIIPSYDRYDWLFDILHKLHNHIGCRYTFKIIVYDDSSTDSRYLKLNSIFSDIILMRSTINGGKEYYWKTINNILEETRKYNFDYLIQIDDDFELCDNFINILLDNHITSNSMDEKVVATTYTRKVARVMRWGMYEWVDGGFVVNQSLLQEIKYKIPQMKRGINESSGVWSYISKQISIRGYKVNIHPEILITHLGYIDSKMHTEFRKKVPIVINRTMKKIVGIASKPNRKNGLLDTLYSLSPQVDEIHVWLNEWDTVPETSLSNVFFYNNNDVGALGKFKVLDYINHGSFYFFTVDDDIIYPPNYVDVNLSHYITNTVQSSHAKVFRKFPIDSFNHGDISGYYFGGKIINKDEVHAVGTGVSLMDSNVAKKIPYNDFSTYPNMVDIWVSSWCMVNDIPMYVIPHELGWLYPNNKISQNDSIWETTKDVEDAFRTSVFNYYLNSKINS